MTDATPVNGGPPRAVMLSIGEIADRDGVSKPAISRKVKQLVDRHGLQVERDEQGRVARVNVAEFDHLRGRFGDPSKAQASRPIASPAPPENSPPASSESYDEALRQKTWHEAEKRRLEVAELKGELVRRAKVAADTNICASEVIRVVDRLPNAADTLAAAVARDGVHGLRVALKKLAAAVRNDIAAAFGALASGAPATDQDNDEQVETANS